MIPIGVSDLLSSLVFLVITLSVFISRAASSLQALEWWSLLCVSVIVLNVSIAMAIIWRQPQNTAKAAFMACLALHNGLTLLGKFRF